jgi:hypothetical protein
MTNAATAEKLRNPERNACVKAYSPIHEIVMGSGVI